MKHKEIKGTSVYFMLIQNIWSFFYPWDYYCIKASRFSRKNAIVYHGRVDVCIKLKIKKIAAVFLTQNML